VPEIAFILGLACGLLLGILFATNIIGVLVLGWLILLLIALVFFGAASSL
jgi:hypothetical protein